MPNVLISGPAGGGKSQAARAELENMRANGPVALADFQAIYVALTGVERDSNGRYPMRDETLLPLVESIRQRIIITARERDIGVVATNSDSTQTRRDYLLGLLGIGSVERVIDPGRAVVAARLAGPGGQVSESCEAAISRWFDNV